jgi:cytoskeleton protein RodZ
MALRKRHRLKFMPGEGRGDQRESVEPTLRLSVGNLLRAERERRDLSVDDVAANLRIRRALIDAIEHGRFKELPGAPYAVGFIKTYAEFLELDREEVIRRFKTEAEGIENRKELNFPRPLSESRLPGGVLLLVSAVIAACAYAFWHFQSADERTQMPRVAALPERLAHLAAPVPVAESAAAATNAAVIPPQQAADASPPAAASVAATPAPASSPTPAQESAAAPAPVPAPASQPVPQAAATPTPAPAPAVAPAPAAEVAAIPSAPTDTSSQPRVFGEGGPNRIVIRATADSWIQIRDTSGTVAFTRVMRPGDVYNVPNRTDLSLYTGSAGALEITVDGKIVPSIGQPGAVRRDVLLDPDRLQAGTAVMDQRRPGASDPNAPRPSAATSSGG